MDKKDEKVDVKTDKPAGKIEPDTVVVKKRGVQKGTKRGHYKKKNKNNNVKTEVKTDNPIPLTTVLKSDSTVQQKSISKTETKKELKPFKLDKKYIIIIVSIIASGIIILVLITMFKKKKEGVI